MYTPALTCAAAYQVVAAAAVFEAESHVTLVVDGGRVGELVRLEVGRRPGLAVAVAECPHDLLVDRAAASQTVASLTQSVSQLM